MDWDNVKSYGYRMKAEEAIAADCIKLFLMSLPKKDAVQKVRSIVNPRVMTLPMNGFDASAYVQTDIDGKQLRYFIDEALLWGIAEIEKDSGLEKSLTMNLLSRMSLISGDSIVEGMTVYFLDFLQDCYGLIMEKPGRFIGRSVSHV